MHASMRRPLVSPTAGMQRQPVAAMQLQQKRSLQQPVRVASIQQTSVSDVTVIKCKIYSHLYCLIINMHAFESPRTKLSGASVHPVWGHGGFVGVCHRLVLRCSIDIQTAPGCVQDRNRRLSMSNATATAHPGPCDALCLMQIASLTERKNYFDGPDKRPIILFDGVCNV